MRKGTGTRRNATSAGSVFAQASSCGSKALQCGHAYEKNSSTSILPGVAPGCGGESLAKSRPSTGSPPVWALAPEGASHALAASPAPRKEAEKSRRFMFMVLETLQQRVAPTAQVQSISTRGADPGSGGRSSRRQHLDPDRRDRMAAVAQARLELRQLVP